ncbi:hypothetical protein GSI_02877 [Ganoderma sinense ZZ0214-1]|uniref:Uncharacterized protein n=1 Tax=Ganoderma sinense ZZ0214-1 TaxID=1077348 RepID=A0A2G8SMW9_9APHY|nr:hypothetical protein GSI_02877 [Ganoderma sinense ZZ0214-1]
MKLRVMPRAGANASPRHALARRGAATNEHGPRRSRDGHGQEPCRTVRRRLGAAARVEAAHASRARTVGGHGSVGCGRGLGKGKVYRGAEVVSEARDGRGRGRRATTGGMPHWDRRVGRRGRLPRLPPRDEGAVSPVPEHEERGEGCPA